MKKSPDQEPGAPSGASSDSLPTFLDEEEFPALCALLRETPANNLEQEISKLVERRLPWRAPRRRLLRVAHLLVDKLDEVVLIKDISRSGVRFLMPKESKIDLSLPQGLTLRIATAEGVRSIGVSLVRVCEHQEMHVDVAFKFNGVELEEGLVQSLRHNIFEPGPAKS